MPEHEVFITIIKTGLSGLKTYPFIFMRWHKQGSRHIFLNAWYLVKVDEFPNKKFETALPVFSGHLFPYFGLLIECTDNHFCLLHTSVLYALLTVVAIHGKYQKRRSLWQFWSAGWLAERLRIKRGGEVQRLTKGSLQTSKSSLIATTYL